MPSAVSDIKTILHFQACIADVLHTAYLYEIRPPFLMHARRTYLDERGTLQQQVGANIVQFLGRLLTQVHVRRGQVIHVKPDVLWKPKTNQLFVFVLVFLGFLVLPVFPANVRRILFDPDKSHPQVREFQRMTSWNDAFKHTHQYATLDGNT